MFRTWVLHRSQLSYIDTAGIILSIVVKALRFYLFPSLFVLPCSAVPTNTRSRLCYLSTIHIVYFNEVCWTSRAPLHLKCHEFHTNHVIFLGPNCPYALSIVVIVTRIVRWDDVACIVSQNFVASCVSIIEDIITNLETNILVFKSCFLITYIQMMIPRQASNGIDGIHSLDTQNIL